MSDTLIGIARSELRRLLEEAAQLGAALALAGVRAGTAASLPTEKPITPNQAAKLAKCRPELVRRATIGGGLAHFAESVPAGRRARFEYRSADVLEWVRRGRPITD